MPLFKPRLTVIVENRVTNLKSSEGIVRQSLFKTSWWDDRTMAEGGYIYQRLDWSIVFYHHQIHTTSDGAESFVLTAISLVRIPKSRQESWYNSADTTNRSVLNDAVSRTHNSLRLWKWMCLAIWYITKLLMTIPENCSLNFWERPISS